MNSSSLARYVAAQLTLTNTTLIVGGRSIQSELRDYDFESLIHSLRVQQSELQVQNEQLRIANAELAASHERISDLYDHAPVGYCTLDRSGQILQANLTAAQMLAHNRADLNGVSLSRFLNIGHADLLQLHLWRVFHNRGKQTCELQFELSDRTSKMIRVDSTRCANADTLQCRTILSDITELSKAQRAAEQNERLAALGTLAAAIAHEVNNPLWMISLQAELALNAVQESQGREDVDEYLVQIRSLVQRSSRIVNSVLRFASGETGARWPNNPASWLTRARDIIRHLMDEKDVKVVLELQANMPSFDSNPTEMEQVFTNLISNAVEASDVGKSVKLIGQWNEAQIQILICDTGHGINADDIDKIQEPFFTTNRNAGGTGLGLSITRQIIDSYQGTIEFESKLGFGTIVTVTLPRNLEPPIAP